MEMRVIVMEMDVEMGVEMGDAKGIRPAGIPFNTKLTTLSPPNNQSKPIVPTLSPPLS